MKHVKPAVIATMYAFPQQNITFTKIRKRIAQFHYLTTVQMRVFTIETEY